MKVAILGPYPADLRFTRGGVEKVTHDLVEGLRDRPDVELHVVTLSDADAPRLVRCDGATIHYVKRQRRFCLPTFSALSVARARAELRRVRPDLVHCQESGLESFIASGLPFPTISTIHAVFRNEAPHYPGLKSQLRYRQIAWHAARARRGVDAYIASSQYVCNEMGDLADRIVGVVENPIDQKWFDLPQEPVPDRVLFAGSMYHRKGVHVLVEALGQLRREGLTPQLHVTGQVLAPDYQAQVQRAVADLGLGDQVRFRGLLPEEELARELAESSVVCLPSFAETSPMIIQQAMAAGKAVLSTRVGGIPWLVEDGVSGLLVEPGDARGLGDGLRSLLADRERCARMGGEARRKALARFTAAAVAERTVEIYRQLLTGKAGER